MARGIDALLHELCVTYGYCGCVKFDKPLHVDDFIPPSGPISADQFVEWVFLADDVNPNSEEPHILKMKAKFRQLVVYHLGGEIFEAATLLPSRKKGKKRWVTS